MRLGKQRVIPIISWNDFTLSIIVFCMSKRIVFGADGKPVTETVQGDRPVVNAGFTLSIRKKPDSSTASQH